MNAYAGLAGWLLFVIVGCGGDATTTCPAQQHKCGGECMANDDVAHCGSSCSACPTPSSGSATCDGTSCGMACGGMTCAAPPEHAVTTCESSVCTFTCVGAYHRCGDACVSNSSVDTCGSSCTPCPAVPANAVATCDGSSCGSACASGFHLCGGACVSNTSPNTCGSACSPCPTPVGGTAICDGTSCGVTCGGTPCAPLPAHSVGTCSGTTCGFSCDSGYHACGSLCASNTSTDSCGSSCTACPTPPANGVATCDGASCGITCASSYHLCGSDCASSSSVNSCGTSCSPCPAPPTNAVATCDGSSCGFTCDAAYHQCGSSCASNTSVASCGSSCNPCASVSHATAGCDGTSCTYACDAHYADCDGNINTGCEADLVTDNANCGSCGHACTAPAACTPTGCVGPPPNDRCASATVIDVSAPARHITLSTTTTLAQHDMDAPCATGTGADVFFKFILSYRELVYADTFGTSWNTVLFFADTCATPIAIATTAGDAVCSDDACATTQSQVVALLAPGIYYLVLSGSGAAGGNATIHFEHAPAGNGPVAQLPAGSSAATGTTSGIGAQYECMASGPEASYWWMSCPSYAGGAFQADTCTGTSFDTALELQVPRGGDFACNDDGCVTGTGSTINQSVRAGAGIGLVTVDGVGASGAGSYTLTVTRP